MELWDPYDAQRQPMNKLQIWDKPIPEDCYYIIVFVWIFTYNGRLPLTKRDACRSGGLLWEVAGGSVLCEETSQEGTRRELYEETGVFCGVEQLQKLHTEVKGRGIYDHYLLQYPVELDKLQLQEREAIDAILVDQSTSEDVARVHILAHPLQPWYHELKDTLTVYSQKNRQQQI